MYDIELVEGKDHPQQMGAKEFDNLGGRIVGLLIRRTRHLWNTAKVVVLDSGFCVAKALIQLAKKGVLGSALIKKCQDWPQDVNRGIIKAHFKEDTECFQMNLPKDNSKLDICGFKEPDLI